MRVVLDTNVVVDHVWARDGHCSNAVNSLKQLRHTLVVCEKLLREYRGVLSGGNQAMYSLVNLLLLQLFPMELMDKQDDPAITITFGPREDRFHMQLAIDSRARYHVTKDQAVLDEAPNMQRHNVRETTPRRYVEDCRRAGGSGHHAARPR